ncbi:hypothetical protein RKE30_35195 [Streptomyces sp. Li-HN-5-11]|uniref:hypothetical protein n=1 Tax=Streptomyces sp. Li-HN-5-11 TaxID=3075432 RepID=UPI0028B1D3B2|nr:hypothetical protein [Streptomyces sp. Li-HN-5-11]WNM35243.1 hypothetical protein RKE30_35195 [Streptomyces sp. Li-HN-5-11]
MIDPEKIPQFTGDLAQLEKDCADLKADAGHVRDTGREVHNRFQGLAAYYHAPEAEQLFATTKPVRDRADGFAGDLETVSGALESYATEVRPLVKKLADLKTEASAFVASVKDDGDWEYDGDKVAHHNRIRDEVTQAVAAFWAAERTCHNKITSLWHGTQMVAGDGSKRKDQYGFNADDLKNAKLPWGDPVEEKHHWYEIGHWVKSFVWDGIVVDGIWGTIKGLGTLVGCQGWDAMGRAWKGLAQLATGLTLSMGPLAGVFWALPDKDLPSWLRESRNTMKQTGKALVAWDEWGKNPARAAGAVTFNVLTTVFTGGEGAAAAGAGKAGAVAKALSVAGKAGRIIDPMTYVAKGAGAGLSKIGDIAKGLKGIGKIDIPDLPENAITLPEGTVKLPDGTVHLPEGAAVPEGATKLPNGAVELPHDAPVLPEGTTRLPGVDGSPAQYLDPHGNLLDHQGNIVQHADQAPTDIVDKPDAGTPAAGAGTPHTPTPTREPALVGAATHTADQTAHVGDHIRLGDSTGHDLADTGRTTDTAPVHAGGESVSSVHAGGDGLPGGGQASDHLPGGHAGDHLSGGSAHEHGAGPSAGHESPPGHPLGNADEPGTGTHDGSAHHGHTSGSHEGPGAGDHEIQGGGHSDGSHGHENTLGDHSHIHAGEGTTPHDHTDHGDQHTDRDVREPRGSIADDAARRDAEPIQLGDQPLPDPAPGENVLGELPEGRVERNPEGLITHVDGRNFEHFLKDLSFQRGEAFRKAKELGTLSRRSVGACAGQVMDLRTGKVIEAINGKGSHYIPENEVHPTLAEKYEALPKPPPAPDNPLGHAEVKAVNALLWERTKLGLPDGEAALRELRAAVEFPYHDHMVTELPGRPAAFCANCHLMLDGVDSLHGRFTGNPATDDNWIP